MLKQRHSSSGLSAKTLSRQKFINRTIQQPHNISTESGKQGKTLRYPTKNKSCMIPRHLAQSTQSHIVGSNQSNRYKTNNRNQPSQKIQNNIQNINPNTQKSTSQLKFQIKSKPSLVESKLTHPENHYRSSTLGQNQLRFSYQPFLSVPNQQSHFKGNILSRLSDLTQNISSCDLVQNIPPHSYQYEKPKISLQPINKVAATSTTMMRQKILEKQVRQNFLYKNMQLTKGLQQMHRFYICVNELRWICEQVHLAIKKYNKQITTLYRQYSQQHKRADLSNIEHQSEQLLMRFNKLQLMNNSSIRGGKLFNFNLLAHNTFSTSQIDNHQRKGDRSHVHGNNHQNNRLITTQINQSPQNTNNSWSKLIQNIQQHNPSTLLLPQHNNNNKNTQPTQQNQYNNLLNQQNKNISIRTFQVTQTNSPYKNKTLNQLIRLSELRKTQFMSNYGSSNNKENNSNQNQKYSNTNENNLNFVQNNNMFIKKPTLQQQKIGIKQHYRSPQEDPFDSIHLPHFNNIKSQQQPNNNNIPPLKIDNKQQQYQQYELLIQQKQFYQSQILRLNKIIQHTNQQINQLHSLIDQKQHKQSLIIKDHQQLIEENKQLIRENKLLNQKIKNKQQQFIQYEKYIHQLVQKALNELITCGKLNTNNNISSIIRNKYSMNNLSQQISRNIKQLQPFIIIENRSFFLMIYCLQQVFKLNQNNSNNNISNRNNNRKRVNNNNLVQHQTIKQKQLLLKQINQLQILKQQLQQQIIKQQQSLTNINISNNINKISSTNNNNNKYNYNSNQQSNINQQSYNQLSQIIFAQAFTIEDILLQMENQQQQSYDEDN